MTPRMVLRGLLKFLAVVLAAGAVGAGLGVALAELTGNDDSTPPAAQITSAAPTATATTPARTTTATQARTGSLTPRVRVLSAMLYPAATPRGRARQRARVVVRVRVTSRSDETIRAQTPVLLVGPHRVRPDPGAADAAGALLRPLPPGESATGELHFDTTGSATRRLRDQRRAGLRIVERTVKVNITISSTPAPAG